MILTKHEPAKVQIMKGEDLARQLTALGIPAILRGEKAGFTLARYDFDLTNPEKLLNVARVLPILEGVNHCKLYKEGSKSAFFSLVAPVPHPQAVYFDYCNPIKTATPAASVGLDPEGQRVVIDFAKCPHLLIAGATGSGKSTLLKTLLASLLLNGGAGYGFALIDPKRVELADFARLPNCLSHAETVPESLALLSSLSAEMDRRYTAMSKKGESDAQGDGDFPPLFCVVDELADLMLVSRYEVETSIVRIAQLGRAANIHLILATQRPTVNVVTGLIKANITTRVALQVASVRDSMTILDHGGAERLLGRGDAIIKYPYSVDEQRFQSALTENRDIEAIVASIN